MQETSYINFRKARTFDEVLRTVFMFVRINLKPLFRSMAIICGPLFLAAAIVGGLFYSQLLPMMLNPSSADAFADNPSSLATFFLYYALIIILMMVSVVMLVTVVNAFISLYVDNGTAPTVEEVWQKTKRHLPSMLGATIISLILTGIASLFFFIPGIYIGVVLSLLFIVQMQENIGVFDAISRCFTLIKGYWWQTAGILFVLYILVTLISYALAIPLWLTFAALFAFTADSSAITVLFPIVSAVFVVPSMLLYALFPVAQAVQYYNIVERKEAAGLREKIEGLQSPEEGWAQGGTL